MDRKGNEVLVQDLIKRIERSKILEEGSAEVVIFASELEALKAENQQLEDYRS